MCFYYYFLGRRENNKWETTTRDWLKEFRELCRIYFLKRTHNQTVSLQYGEYYRRDALGEHPKKERKVNPTCAFVAYQAW